MRRGHLKWMLVLCLAPIGIFIILQAVGVGLGNGLLFLLFILCPASHLLMMRGKEHNHGGDEVVEAEKVDGSAKNSLVDSNDAGEYNS